MSQFMDRPLVDWVTACINRLTDNYEWQDTIEYDDWVTLQKFLIASLVTADKTTVRLFVMDCLDQGVIEDDYFGNDGEHE